MNLPYPIILLAESEANVVAYILLIAGPLLALLFGYFWRKAKRTRDLMSATETCPIGQLTEGPAEIRGRTATSEATADQSLATATSACTTAFTSSKATLQHEQQRSHDPPLGDVYQGRENTAVSWSRTRPARAVVDSSKIKFVINQDQIFPLRLDERCRHGFAATARDALQ